MTLIINGASIELTDLQAEQLRSSGWLKLSREQWQQAFGTSIRPMRAEHTDRTIEKALAVLNGNDGPQNAA